MAAAIPGASLSAADLAQRMLESLPVSADPQIKTPIEAIALCAHTCLLSVDFRLVGLDEDHRIGQYDTNAASLFLNLHVEANEQESQALPSAWNANRTISFKYAHPQSSMQFVLTVSKMGTKAVINALALGDEKVASVDVPLDDYISPSALPYSAPADRTSVEASHNIQQLFISAGRIADFANLLKTQIIQKLIPKLQKEGYEESTSQTAEGSRADDASRNRNQREDIAERERAPPRLPSNPLPPFAMPRPFDDPLATGPRRGGPVPDFAPPGFEDEHGILRPPGRGGFGDEGLRMPNIGERDLYPPGLGPNDPLRIGPGGGYRGGGGGMYPAFDDPVFGNRGQQGGGGGGYNPMAPPGARYDPIGPGDGVPRDPNARRGFPGAGGGGGGGGGGLGGMRGPSNPFGGYGSGDFI